MTCVHNTVKDNDRDSVDDRADDIVDGIVDDSSICESKRCFSRQSHSHATDQAPACLMRQCPLAVPVLCRH